MVRVSDMAKQQHLIVYLDDLLAVAIKAAAEENRLSASAFAGAILERELAHPKAALDAIHQSLIKLQIAVDALVKYHPNDKLFGIVKATRNARLRSASDEA
jgi:hypothetical protein